MNQGTGVAVDPKQELDLKVEPVKPEDWAKAEVWLEAGIIKNILPSYRKQREPFDLQAIAIDPLNRWWYLYEYFPGELPSSDLATLTAQDTVERSSTNCGDIVRADPSGKFVYAIGNTTSDGICGDQPGAILGFSVNQSNGTLTPLSGSPFASPNADYYDEDGLVVTQ